MILFLDNFSSINNGLLIVYGLIICIILLIVVVLVVDKMKRHKKDTLFHSKHLKKRLRELQNEEDAIDRETEQKTEIPVAEVIETETSESKMAFDETEVTIMTSKEEIRSVDSGQVEVLEEHSEKEDDSKMPISTDQLSESSIDRVVESDYEKESDLEKTQAQIEVEAITKALEKAVEEEKESNKYAKFEEEQELNAIISYDELKEKFDELYDSNEKIQYVNDDTIPINLKELYDTKELVVEHQPESKPEVVSQKEIVEKPVQIDDLYHGKDSSEFKKSPIISPVYGIQKEELPVKKEVDERLREEELQKTADFLNTLKELQRNLD